MTKSRRVGLAALFIGCGILVGVLLTTGLEWTAPGLSQLSGERHLTGAQGEVPEELKAADQMSKAFVKVAQMVNPSVVTVAAEKVVRPAAQRGRDQRLPENHPFREFFGDDFFDRYWNMPDEGMPSQGLGSGVIVSEDGYILTNNHVVSDAQELKIGFMDDRELDAKIIGADPESDVALIKVEANDLPAVRFGDSDQLQVGEWVVAIGSPFSENLAHTVTAGIVSAKGRTNVNIVDFEDFIQTDAAINPGNSGGALVNLRGELVGINTAIATRSGFYQGVGFAIPVNMARKVMDDLLNRGKVVRGWLGVQIQSVDDDLAAGLGLDSKRGVVIADLTPGGPADRSGMKHGDVVLEFNGTPVKDPDHLQSLVAAQDPGKPANLKVRRDKKDLMVKVDLGERPTNARESFRTGGSPEPETEKDEEQSAPAGLELGIAIAPLNDARARELGYEDDEGVVVEDVARGGPAANKNIRPGDLIKEVNRRPVKSVSDFRGAVSDLKPGETALLLIRRGEQNFFAAVKVTEPPEKGKD
jgi:serine protease Do